MSTFLRRFLLAVSIVVCALVPNSRAYTATAGNWVPLTNVAPDYMSTMLLLTDGSILAQGYYDRLWFRLTPDHLGSYRNGTWSQVAPMHDTRLYYASVVMRDGRVLVGGGEYGTGGSTIEVYDPVLNKWSELDSWNMGYGATVGISDSTAKVMDDGRVLLFPYISDVGYIYDPILDTWTQTSAKIADAYNDEESVVHLANGDFIQCDNFDNPVFPAHHQSQRFNPTTGSWISCGPTPVNLVDSGYETGPATLLYDGRVLFLGATGTTALYTPPNDPTDTMPGTWQAGPTMPNSPSTGTPFGCDDAPSAIMPNGRVLFVADSGSFNPPTACFEFDASASSFTSIPIASTQVTGNPAFVNRMLLLPSGEVLMSTGADEMDLYIPGDGPLDAWRPTISSIVDNHDGTFAISGTQFNGLTEGAAYGDDAQMATNYPSVRLTDGGGNVYFANTTGFSTMGVATGTTVVSAIFAPARVPNGNYSVAVVTNGIASAAVPFILNRTTTAPIIVSTPVTTAQAGIEYAYQLTATGTPTPTFSLVSAPAGMAIDPTTGYVTWTPSVGGYVPVTLSAANGIAPTASQSFIIACSGPPLITSTPVVVAAVGQPYTYTLTVGDPPTPSFSLSVAPAGMTINASTGVISWTPSAVGSAAVTVDVANGLAPNASQSFVITVNLSPTITNAPLTTIGVNQHYAWTVQATGVPTPTFSLSTAPPGMTIDPALGSISWTPTTSGSYLVTVVASNGVAPDATLTYRIAVTAPPVITSSAPATGVVGQIYSYQVTASGYPAVGFALSAAPTGMSIDAVTGRISWVPSAAGTISATVVASNGINPAATQTFSVLVYAPPVITSTAVTTVVLGSAYSYTVVATGSPAPTFLLTTAPTGMTIDPFSGMIAWTPTLTGAYAVTIQASNGTLPVALQSFTLSVTAAPLITSHAIVLTASGSPYLYPVTASGFPAPIFSLVSAPAGMACDRLTGDITWNPTLTGSFAITVTATNGVNPAALQSFTLVVGTPAVITSSPPASVLLGMVYSYTMTVSGTPAATYSVVSGPVGMAIDPASGVLSWTPSAVGVYAVTIEASNGLSPASDQTFIVTVNEVPVFDAEPMATTTVGSSFTESLRARAYPAPVYAITNAPAGMTIDASTGQIRWVPAATGLYVVDATASNGLLPNAALVFRIQVQDPVATPVPAQSSGGSSGTGGHCGIGGGSLGVLTVFLVSRRRRI